MSLSVCKKFMKTRTKLQKGKEAAAEEKRMKGKKKK